MKRRLSRQYPLRTRSLHSRIWSASSNEAKLPSWKWRMPCTQSNRVTFLRRRIRLGKLTLKNGGDSPVNTSIVSFKRRKLRKCHPRVTNPKPSGKPADVLNQHRERNHRKATLLAAYARLLNVSSGTSPIGKRFCPMRLRSSRGSAPPRIPTHAML